MASAVSARPRLRSWPDTLASRLNCSSNGTIERLDPDASTEVLGVKSAANPAPRHARPAANNSVGRASRDVSAGGAITVGQALTATDPVSGSNRAPQPKTSTGHGPPHRLAPRDRARTAGDHRRHGPTACTIPRPTPEFWLKLQVHYELRVARQTKLKDIEHTVRPRSEAA